MLSLADTATWIGVGVAVGVAALALMASLVLLVLVLRRTRAADEDQPAPKASAGALELSRSQTPRSERLSEIATTIDLDAVLERTLAAAVSTGGIDAAMAVVRQADDMPITATYGMSTDEAARQPVSSSPPGAARAVRISYHYGADGDSAPEGLPGEERIGGGLAVPLREEHVGTIGTLAVFWRGGDRVPEDGEIAELEAIAQTSAPAIRNAQQFQEARQLADLDPLTGVHNRRYFEETLERECARAHRYERGVALLLLAIDPAGDAVLTAVGERLLGTARQTDVACRIGGNEFGVILPEAGAGDAEQLSRRIELAVASDASGPAGRIQLSAGIAELRPQDDVVALFQRADDALYEAKEAAKGQVERPQGLPSGWAD